MAFQTKYEQLIKEGNLYNHEFLERFGYSSSFWDKSNWCQREASLRHDMVCMLLCNTEPIDFFEREKVIESMEPPNKKKRLEECFGSGSSNESVSTNEIGSDITKESFDDIGGDGRYRHILLEGRSNPVLIQNVICKNFGIDKLTRQYDIFDIKEKKFVEVKVTLNKDKSLHEFLNYFDNPGKTAFFHINPITLETYSLRKSDELPGKGKAISFLMKRLTLVQVNYNIQESDIDYETSMIENIFVNDKFNKMMSDWQSSFWDLRNLPLLEADEDPTISQPIKTLNESTLKGMIEDTTIRKEPFMQFKAKLMPDAFTAYVLTTEHEDKEMLNVLLKGTSFDDDTYLNWVVNLWKDRQDTFNVLNNQQFKNAPEKLLIDLGIEQKGTTRHDGCPELKQKEFQKPPKRRYSAWLSNLMKDLTEMDNEGLLYFTKLCKSEFVSEHPIARASQKVVDKVFDVFSETALASYCSKVKNFYSRLGGAYLKRDATSSKRPAVVMFPLYASGDRDGEKVRKLSGFVIRGPQHAKKPTDRIPYISMELMGNSEKALKYQKFIKNPRFVSDNQGRKWCLRVNSIMKHDTSYITFVIDSIYLTSNMIGEMVFQDPRMFVEGYFSRNVENFILENQKWFLERMVESVLMATMGNSQEEGTLAAVRKIFMLKMNWMRGKRAWGADLQGFADSLNECLFDQPLALYFAKQFRDILDD